MILKQGLEYVLSDKVTFGDSSKFEKLVSINTSFSISSLLIANSTAIYPPSEYPTNVIFPTPFSSILLIDSRMDSANFSIV
jgi:hypothetical protein